MIGLPDSVWACLFDLDGVMTHTATVHAAVWRLGSRKNELVLQMIREEGVEAYDGSVRYLEAARHERVLDLRAGVLRRRAERVYPAGQAVLVSSVRLVSLTQRDRGHSALHAVKPQQACGAPGRSLD